MNGGKTLVLMVLGFTLGGSAFAQMTGKIAVLSQPWRQSPIDQGSGPTIQNGWVEAGLKVDAALEIPRDEGTFLRVITTLRGAYLSEARGTHGIRVQKEGTVAEDPTDPRLRVESFRFVHQFLEDDKVNWATLRGRVTVRTDSATVWDYERLSNNIDYSEKDPKRRLTKIQSQKPEARQIYSKGDAGHLHRLLVRITVRLVPDSVTGKARLEATYRRDYVIYAMKLPWGTQKANAIIIHKVKKNTTGDLTEGFATLLSEIEKGLRAPD